MSPVISLESIRFNASLGNYYDQKKADWQSMGRIESIIRSFFSNIFMDSVELACQKRSWKAIETMPTLPEKIVENIDHYFNVLVKNELYSVANSVSKIYARIWREKSGMHFTILEDRYKRLFNIVSKGENFGTVVSSDYGKLDFYAMKEKMYANRQDDLLDKEEKNVLFRMRKVTYVSKDDKYYRTNPQYVVSNEIEELQFIMQKEEDPSTFAIRHPFSKQILAIALWSQEQFDITPFNEKLFQQWSVTVLDPSYFSSYGNASLLFGNENSTRLDLLVWSLLKRSQEKMEGTYERPYITNYQP